MTKSQKFGFYLPAWNETARVLNWRMKEGRLMAARPQYHGSPEATALMHAVWQAAEILALCEHRAVTTEDLRRGVTVAATGQPSSKDLNTREVTRVVAALDLLAKPDDLAKMNRWLHPEIAERDMLVARIAELAFDEGYVSTISASKFGTKSWRNLSVRQLGQLLFTLQNRVRGKARAAAVVALLFSVQSASAVLFQETADPTHNTAAPTGELAGSGWQWTGFWGGVTGTTISPNQFITAKHVGGSIGQTFNFDGVSYRTTGVTTSGDLAVWTVDGIFGRYAPILAEAPAAGTGAVIMGRGTQRGAEIWKDGELAGWTWGTADGVLRWGVNTVDVTGRLIRFTFDATTDASISAGDSGGGVFVQDGGIWKLAGINYGVTKPGESLIGGRFYAHTLGEHSEWLSAVVAVQVPEPAAAVLVGLGALTWLARRR